MVVVLVACVIGTISKNLEIASTTTKGSCQDKVQENIHVIVSMVPLARAIMKSGWILAIKQIFDQQDMI